MPNVPAVSMEGLTKVYATGVRAVNGLDLAVEPGEFAVLVGPSGCGKTTALRMVAGLEGITAGTLRFGDRVVNDVSPRHRDVAMVFQNYALYPHLTVAQNIGFSLENKRVPRADRDRRVRAAAGVLGLGDLLGRKPGQLSGGQRQRVAMGRAIVREPSVFCLDEPLSNLDAKLRVQMRGEILRVHRAAGATTLYVTHDQTEAMTMGDRVAVLRAGVLEQYGTPRELYERPASLFVAAFIGSPAMNLYEAAIDGAGSSVVVGAQRLALEALSQELAGYRGRKVVVGIRPERLVVGGTAGAGRSLAVEVRLVEPLGSEQLVHFTLDAPPVREDTEPGRDEVAEGEMLAAPVANGVAVTPPRAPVRAGARAVFAVEADALHFFDPDTHLAIGGR